MPLFNFIFFVMKISQAALIDNLKRPMKNGRCSDSLIISNEVLPKVQEAFAKHHASLGIIWHGSCNMKMRLEKFQDALCTFQNAITSQCHVSDATESCAKIGIVHLLYPKCSMELTTFQQILSMRIQKLGNSHPNEARACSNVGSITST